MEEQEWSLPTQWAIVRPQRGSDSACWNRDVPQTQFARNREPDTKGMAWSRVCETPRAGGSQGRGVSGWGLGWEEMQGILLTGVSSFHRLGRDVELGSDRLHTMLKRYWAVHLERVGFRFYKSYRNKTSQQRPRVPQMLMANKARESALCKQYRLFHYPLFWQNVSFVEIMFYNFIAMKNQYAKQIRIFFKIHSSNLIWKK